MKIAIVGYGIEGKASYKYWNTPDNELVIVDERTDLADIPEGAQTILGTSAFSKLSDFDLIIRSPGIHPEKLPYGEKVWSATNEFFAKCPAPIIGVTGTKGKGTTSSLIASILAAAGKTVHLIGNIGTPALAKLVDIQPSDVVVYELSSFQLWDVQTSPHVAVVLMIEADHLDVHSDFDEYIQAKMNIARWQHEDDIVIFNKNNQWSKGVAQTSSAQHVIPYPFAIDGFAESLRIPGKHNQENAAAAIAAARQFTVSDETIRQGMAAFDGLPHRLKFAAEKDGVQYFDDSIATTPGSAIAAIRSFERPKVLILGGSDKGASYDEIVEVCRETATKVVAIGQTGEVIERACREKGVECIRETGDMRQIVASARALSEPGGVVILSPASASFDMFKNYADRGDQFAAAAKDL